LYKSAIGQEFNLASGGETKIIDLANMISEAVGNKAGIKFVQKRKWDTKSRLLASVDRAKELIGYQPKTDFKKGLANTIQSAILGEKGQLMDKGFPREG
jgi:UDP-glucose 4-epimerase